MKEFNPYTRGQPCDQTCTGYKTQVCTDSSIKPLPDLSHLFVYDDEAINGMGKLVGKNWEAGKSRMGKIRKYGCQLEC